MDPCSSSTRTAGSRPAEIACGTRMGLPVLLGYLPLGFAFGVLAVSNGVSPLIATLMSLLVFAGAGQYIAVGMIGAGSSIAAVAATTFIVNLRHILMCAALAPYVRPLCPLLRVLYALEITDETFAVHSTAFRGGAPCIPARLFACNLTAHGGWIGGTALGVFMGSLIPDTRPWGLDFALPAMFLALLVPLCWERLHLVVGLAAAAMSLGFTLAGLGRASVLLATVLAAALGLWLSLRRGDDLQALTRGPETPHSPASASQPGSAS